MQLLRNEYKLDLCFTPLYMLENTDLKICYLNTRSLHKHIEDILIFTETRFSPHDPDEMYAIEGYELFRHDDISNVNRPYHGTAICSRLPMFNRYPCARIYHGVEITILKTVEYLQLMVIGIYRSPKLALSSLLAAIHATLQENHSSNVIVIGDFNVNWFDEVAQISLYNLMINENALEDLYLLVQQIMER